MSINHSRYYAELKTEERAQSIHKFDIGEINILISS